MTPIEKLRLKAMDIPVLAPSYISAAIIDRIRRHREEVLASDDITTLEEFMEKATDEECLCVFSELSLRAPLNDEAFKMYMHLSVKVFTKMGVSILDGTLDAGKGELSSYHHGLLEHFRRDVRKSLLKGKGKGKGSSWTDR